ncbi:uncharacterized protein LOC143021975 [Oratosquilla oratoria]|uniref:uncharacterized protein LOC143021975 n=1 Tax=Oratosquilla oratoria TaxID=337810 RepID=UPI003F762201
MTKGKGIEDEMTTEMFEALGDFGIKIITEIANKVYGTGDLTEQMCQSVFIALPKIHGTLECSKHRIISIMNHLTKITLRVITNRIRNKIRPEIANEQYGFVPDKGTRYAIFVVRLLPENMLEVQKDLYACFVDYEKALDKRVVIAVQHAVRLTTASRRAITCGESGRLKGVSSGTAFGCDRGGGGGGMCGVCEVAT